MSSTTHEFDICHPQYHDGRLLWYDVFRGLNGKVFLIPPLFAVKWLHRNRPRAVFSPTELPEFMFDCKDGPGYVKGLKVNGIPAKVHFYHWSTFICWFDIKSDLSKPLNLEVTFSVKGQRLSQKIILPPVPRGRGIVECTTLCDAPHAREFVEHCKAVGFDDVVLYDNNATPTDVPGARMVRWNDYPYWYDYPPEIKADDPAINWKYGNGIHPIGCQSTTNVHALYKYGGTHDWVGFFDTDEFVNCRGKKLEDVLRPHLGRKSVGVAGVRFGGRDFGGSSLRQRFQMCENNRHYTAKKGFVCSRNVVDGEKWDVHNYTDIQNTWAEIDGETAYESRVRANLDTSVCQMNHYQNCGWNNMNIGRRLEEEILTVHDASILSYVSELEVRLQDIPGWFSYERLYSDMIDKAPAGSVFVELGVWLGRSAGYMATEIKRRQKDITFHCVDNWLQTPDMPNHSGDIFAAFQANMRGLFVAPVCHRMNTWDAAKDFADSSVDFVFVDATHSYECVKKDIEAWLPKLKPGGTMAGHDIGQAGVRQAVDEAFGSRWVLDEQMGTWTCLKP